MARKRHGDIEALPPRMSTQPYGAFRERVMTMTDSLPERVRAFFRDSWDPACVGGDPHARDEYLAYEETFLALLRAGAFSCPGRLRAFVEGTEEAIRGEVSADRADRIAEALAALAGDGVPLPTSRATG